MGFQIGVPIPIGYYHGASGQTIKARIEDESGAVFGAELTLVENAAFVLAGINGFYESSFTPDAAGRWTALVYYSSIKYGQMFYDVGGGDVPAQDAVTNARMRDVIGNKNDTPVQDADAVQKSIIALVKGILDILWDDAGIAAWSAAAAPANGVSLSEAVRYIVENQIGASFDGTPSLYTAIITGYTGAATSTPIGALVERLQLLQETLVNANTKFQSSAATVNTVTCAALVDRAGLYEKMMLVPLDGNQAGQGRYITDYDGTGVVTVVPDWSTDPDAGGAFYFVIVPTPAGFLYEAGKGLSANYDLVNGIPVLTRIYNDYDIQILATEETVFEYDDAAYVWHPEWLVFHLDEAQAGEQFEVRIYEKDNDTDDNWRLMDYLTYLGAQAVPVKYLLLPPIDLAFKVTVEQTGGVLRDALFKLYKKS